MLSAASEPGASWKPAARAARETRHATVEDRGRAHVVEHLTVLRALEAADRLASRILGLFPERPQAADASGRWIASDDGGIDRANRDGAGDPVGQQPDLVEGLVGAAW